MSHVKRLFIYVLTGLLGVAGSAQLYAGSLRENGLQSLLNTADLVVYGRFTSVTSEWRGNKIFTRGAFNIERVFKGEAVSSITIEYMGGTAVHPRLGSPVTMRSSEGISFVEGEEAVLLLNRVNDDLYQIIGMNRGKISVVTSADGAKQLQGLRRIRSSSGQDNSSLTVDSVPMNLDDFAAYCSSLLQTGSGR